MKTAIIIITIVVLIVIGLFLFRSGSNPEDINDNQEEEMIEESPSPSLSPTITPEEDGKGEVSTIVYSDSGFSPRTLEVERGTTVIFKNNSSQNFWPASAVHPIHSAYPNSSLSFCGTARAINAFDACQGIAVGGEFSFVFNEIGTWAYHDHLEARQVGTIIIR
ncbi:MAG: hypothetical protein COV31_00555 [Candidatus Yanofskybacteria bacterium CG10_big_fil_rev_8_21_14_0_10_46_23]|uniref:EfeO-type cupredoxin-like domain-containing protein n=1 Tax=Candidatus Yanofskybacteria bacterium CG10_big_fil_rev_8_21_14_0_10_46_23 TaxID=1975098 RepID=A0A2H0R5H2_9BACT|nr:MAG: hypothetical protein COV31_00555 [Candidatus Yanofskybacteria bacterium CG10_big_fil_rev_8_21_14_0_10_46_23]